MPCLLLIEFSRFRGDFGEAIGETLEETASRSIRQITAEHFEDVLSGVNRSEKARRIRSDRRR